ncbi:GPR1/FUN34/yaaH family-domain-containing protein [Penicillium canariense]|uniref:GPR1/FUN34/yaaH family-domain-containing protein n=1 Tax=Penicillium canariense TaxID=189055 RepID=A0A9W9I4W6_9EURO|nr:GPR1/FUN34/yaaH family-domain-containing protein [Penicillium canariense]KAJ5168029.1 GPR1/FUN34/yaaH family-domain-containing protein [Penicillium canariense]
MSHEGDICTHCSVKGPNDGPEQGKENITNESTPLSRNLPEKIYVSCASTTRRELKAILGNPTPLGVMGFILSLTPMACDLMEWRGAGGFGAATVGVAYFFGGLLMILAAVLEFILGNTFIFVVFSSYAAFWLSLAATLTPFYAAYTAYDPSNPENPGFNNSYGPNPSYCKIFFLCH